jgi:amidophosphoribosyltransferase
MCGIFGIYDINYNNNIINNVVKGLQKLQHRGKCSYGFSYINKYNELTTVKNQGNMREYDININTKWCIGHVRYTTSGKSVSDQFISDNEIQPLSGFTSTNKICIVHNGNIPNILGHDTEYLLNMIISNADNIEESLINVMNTIPASYSLIVMYDNNLYVMKDRYGIRPLSIGYKDSQIYISSETCALDNCMNIFEVKSGQILKISKNGIDEIYIHPKAVDAICAFELIYFMNPQSYYKDIQIKEYRKQLSHILAHRDINTFSNDYIVVGVPESGLLYGQYYADIVGLKTEELITKYTDDRTFILLKNEDRKNACKKKFKYGDVKDKKIILLDDTIVRGNVIQAIVDNLKEMGVKEIHIRIPAPPVVDICQLGIAIHNKKELIMHNRTEEEVAEILGVNSLKYLTVDDLKIFPKDSYTECFSGYIPEEIINYKQL